MNLAIYFGHDDAAKSRGAVILFAFEYSMVYIYDNETSA